MSIKRLAFIFILFLVILPFFSAELVSADGEIEGDFGFVEKIQDGSLKEEIQSINSTSEIKEKLLKNPAVIKVDESLKKGNLIFQILFGVDYSFSLFFLLAFAIWLFLLNSFDSIFYGYSSFSPLLSFLIACLFVIISAQFGTIKFFAGQANKFILWWYSFFKGDKPLWIEILVIGAFFVLIIILACIIKKLGKNIRENRKKLKEQMNQIKLDQGAKMSEVISKAIGSDK